ncbi:hypothetical protein ACQZ6F_17405 [Rhizobium sp. A22-96]
MPNHAVVAAGEAMSAGNILANLRDMLKSGDVGGALSLLDTQSDESRSALPSLHTLRDLIDRHVRLWEIDEALWRAFSDIEDSEPMKACPPLRVQIGTLRHGCDEEGQPIRTPIHATSLEQIAQEAQKNMDFQIGLFVSRDNAAGIARLEAKRTEWVAEKTAQFNAICAERTRIQDECGFTAAEQAAFASTDAVKDIERQIVDLATNDFETA